MIVNDIKMLAEAYEKIQGQEEPKPLAIRLKELADALAPAVNLAEKAANKRAKIRPEFAKVDAEMVNKARKAVYELRNFVV